MRQKGVGRITVTGAVRYVEICEPTKVGASNAYERTKRNYG